MLGDVSVDFAIWVSPHTRHLGILMNHYVVSFITLHKGNGDRTRGKGGKAKREEC